MMRVYIAGPHTAPDPIANTGRALAVFNELLDLGYMPFCPHLMTSLAHMVQPRDYETWMGWCFGWVAQCQVVLVLGDSPGTRREIGLAQKLGIPVIWWQTTGWHRNWLRTIATAATTAPGAAEPKPNQWPHPDVGALSTMDDPPPTETDRRLIDVGVIPGIDVGCELSQDAQQRRGETRMDFKRWCKTYAAATFSEPWTGTQIEIIGTIETAILTGGPIIYQNVPHGCGTTSLLQQAAIWALLQGHAEYLVYISATHSQAESILSGIWDKLQTSHKLLRDFPEVCQPIRALGGVLQRRPLLRHNGEPVHLCRRKRRITLPWQHNRLGGTIDATGCRDQMRGLILRHDQCAITKRPDLVLVDNPQELATPSACAHWDGKIWPTIQALGGPGREISGVCVGTFWPNATSPPPRTDSK